MVFTPSTGNYNPREEYVTVTVDPKGVNKPTLAGTSLVYTGNILQPTVNHTDSTLYTVSIPDSINTGDYKVTVSLNDKTNYVWADSDSNDIELPYTITPGQATVEAPVIENWTFGSAESIPTSGVNYDGAEITYLYSASYSGEYSETVPTAAGTYYVKAQVTGNSNYLGATSEPTEFTIGKADAVISGLNSLYTLTYNRADQTIDGITLNHSEASLVYKLDGETVSAITVRNAGTYTVTVTVAETTNYKSATKTATIVVNAAENTETVNDSQTATYLDRLTSLSLPDGIEGEWSWLEGDVSVGNAGTNTFTAVFTPENGNYLERRVPITVTVSKKSVTVPTVANKVYTSSTITSGLTDTALYTVESDLGGVNVAKYGVTLKLVDSSNYKWSTTDSETVTVDYEITKATNSWTTAPTVSDITFGDSISYTAVSKYDSVKVTYRPKNDASAAFTDTAPTAAGTYIARFTTVSVNAYACEETDVIFTIGKRMITIPQPTLDSFVYGETVNLGISDTTYYTFTDNSDTNAGAKTATVSLIYPESTYWSDGADGADRTINYTIEKATITLSNLAATGWTYLDSPISPTVDKDKSYGTVVFKYSTTKNGTYTTDVPTNAGTYYVKAVIEEAANWKYAETATPVTLVITPATPTITLTLSTPNSGGAYYENLLDLVGDSTVSYKGQTPTGSITASVTFNSSDPAASPYTITFTSSDSNYTNKTVTGTINLKTVATVNLGGTKFGTIENALRGSASGDTIWVLPDTTGNVIIKETTVDILSGRTLLIPYGTTDDTEGRNKSDESTLFYKTKGTTIDGVSFQKPETYLKTLVTVAGGTTLNVYGTLEISGEMSGGAGGQKFASQTAGRYAALELDSGATVTLHENAVAKVYGVIKDVADTAGGTLIANSGSSLYQPLTLLDFKGGSLMTGIFYGMGDYEYSPFNQFCLLNISSRIRMNHGSNMYNYCNLYADDKHNSTVCHMIGSGGFIELTDSVNSYIEAKLDPETFINDVHIYGGAKTNTMSLTVLGETISSDQFVFALTWLFDITLAKADGQSGTAYFTMTNKYKMMPGSRFTVEAGAELSIDFLTIYKNFTDYIHAGVYKSTYPAYTSNSGATIPEAVFMIRGTVIAGSIGGDVYTDVGGAKLQVKDAVKLTTYEPTKTNGNLSFLTRVTERQTIVRYLKLHYGNNTVGYTVAGITYDSDAATGKWIYPEIEIPPTIAVTIPEGYHVTTNDAVIVDGKNVDFYSYDSTVDGPKTIYVFADAEIVYHLTKNEVLVLDGSTSLTVSNVQDIHTEDYKVTWYANTTDTPTVYWVPCVTVNMKVTLDSYSITYENLGTATPRVKIYLKQTATATALGSCSATAKFTVTATADTTTGAQVYSKTSNGLFVANATVEGTVYVYEDDTITVK